MCVTTIVIHTKFVSVQIKNNANSGNVTELRGLHSSVIQYSLGCDPATQRHIQDERIPQKRLIL